MNNDISFIGFNTDLTFDTSKFTFHDFYFTADNKSAIIKTDAVGRKIQYKTEVIHLLVRNNKHVAGKEIFHIKKRDTILISQINSCLLGTLYKD